MRFLILYSQPELGHVAILYVGGQRTRDLYPEVVHGLAVPLHERLDGGRIAGEGPRFSPGVLSQETLGKLWRRGILAQIICELGQQPAVVEQVSGVTHPQNQISIIEAKELRIGFLP